ncbi:MAG: hypothetical protein QM500_12500 [Methylococcales bacterium]
MENKPITTMVKKFLLDNEGWVSENDRIEAIVALAGYLSTDCKEPKGCTETDKNADTMCGARSMVELAMSRIHQP